MDNLRPLRSERAANMAMDPSKALHRDWMEPSLSTQLRVSTTVPRSLLGRFLNFLWSHS